jgi:hypothetical protein
LGECVGRIGVFMERARSWARRAVVEHAVRMIRPVPEVDASGLFASAKQPRTSTTRNPFAAVVSLRAFERFVFVMSVLEGQSDEDCQDLLRCSRLEIEMARDVAFRFLAVTGVSSEHSLNGSYTWPKLLH